MFDLFIAAGLAVAISAFCSITEAVLYSVPWSHIEHLREEGKATGRLLYKLRADVEKPIAAVLTLNTIANTAGASIAGAAAARVYGSEALGIFAAIFTLAILIFSEILPKTMGVVYCRTLAPMLAKPLQVLVWTFLPVHWLTGFLARAVRPARSRGPQTTEADINAVASLTRRSGVIQPYEEQTIKNILTLDEKTVEEIMTPRTVVFSMSSSLGVEEASRLEDIFHYSRIPVYENGNHEDIVGLIYRRNVLEALAHGRGDATIGSMMRPVNFVQETLSLDRLLLRFLESRVHLLVVLDEYGGMAGVVSLEDVMEEILGKEIVDETDEVEDLRALAHARRQQLTRAK